MAFSIVFDESRAFEHWTGLLSVIAVNDAVSNQIIFGDRFGFDGLFMIGQSPSLGAFVSLVGDFSTTA